jgi:hypothetical protein
LLIFNSVQCSFPILVLYTTNKFLIRESPYIAPEIKFVFKNTGE